MTAGAAGAIVAVLVLTASGAMGPAGAQAMPGSSQIHHRPLRSGAWTGVRHRFRPLRPPRLLAPAPPDENLVPPPGGRSFDEDESGGAAPLPHGFALTVPMRSGDVPHRPATLGRFVEVGRALAGCWHPPVGVAWSAVTVRVAFRRDGTIYGLPRIPFVDAAGVEAKASVTQSLGAALKSCVPLPFSPSLGAAVAGEIFAIRFVNQDRP